MSIHKPYRFPASLFFFSTLGHSYLPNSNTQAPKVKLQGTWQIFSWGLLAITPSWPRIRQNLSCSSCLVYTIVLKNESCSRRWWASTLARTHPNHPLNELALCYSTLRSSYHCGSVSEREKEKLLCFE